MTAVPKRIPIIMLHRPINYDMYNTISTKRRLIINAAFSSNYPYVLRWYVLYCILFAFRTTQKVFLHTTPNLLGD